MKITNWTLHRLDKNFHVLVELHTDAGASGWGAAYSQTDQVLGALGWLKKFVIGQSPLEIERVTEKLHQLSFWLGRGGAMHPRLRPLLPDRKPCGFVGRARTVRWMETDYVVEGDPYGLEIEAIDSLRPGDVVVHSSDRSGTIVPWGELMTTVAKRNGAVGCVCDAAIRDCTRIIDLGFPVYSAGISPLDFEGARAGHGLRRADSVRRGCGAAGADHLRRL